MRHLHVRIKDYLLANTNSIIRVLILSDVCYIAGAGLLGPIFSLFVIDFIQGGGAEVAGIAIAVYLVTKSLAQIPVGMIVDRVRGDVDDFWFMFGGLFVASLVPISYLFISTPLQLYAAEFVLGLALAVNFPPYMALFTKYVDENREATAWSIYFTISDFASAGTAALGGLLATVVGFHAVIIGITCLGLIGTFSMLSIRHHLRPVPVKADVNA